MKKRAGLAYAALLLALLLPGLRREPTPPVPSAPPPAEETPLAPAPAPVPATVRLLRENGVEDIAIRYLTQSDVVRHVLVQRIVKAYEDYEEKKKARPSDSQPRQEDRQQRKNQRRRP